MSLFALPVTVDDILLLQDSIQFFTNQAQATSQAAAINAETSTVYDYAQQLLAANLATSQVAVAVPSLILNETPTVGVIENITLNFLPDQIDFAISQGLDPVVYAAEAWAVNVASSNAADFNALYGNLNSTQFAAVVSTTTGVNTDAILNFIANWQAFFSANPNAIPANLNVTTASYAAAFGDAIGNALVDDSVFTEGVNAFAENALLTIATGQYLEGVPPGAIPQHIPLQGEPGSDLTLTVNVDTLTTQVAGAIFEAPPGSNPPLGTTNTLNTGDTLTSTVGDATLNFTAIDSSFFGANDPFALGVTMDGISTANIQNLADDLAGFAGDITGLTTVTIEAGSNPFGDVQLGLTGLGLNTALETININAGDYDACDLPGGDLNVWIESAAFAGGEAVDVNLGGVGTWLDLNVTGGANFYETVNVSSDVSANKLEVDTNADTVATVTVDGDQDLLIGGSLLNQDTLTTFDSSAATGDVTAFFGGPAGALTAIGGAGDENFTFLTPDDETGPTTFTSADSVDGDGGDNKLTLQAFTGALLGAGVGPNIVNIQTIVHTTFVNAINECCIYEATDAPITVDMANAGSANILELQGNYNNLIDGVSVTNLAVADTVIYSGFNLNDLNLESATLLGDANLTLAQDECVQQFDPSLTTHQLNDVNLVSFGDLNIFSTGLADLNDINDFDDVDANVEITGDVDLTLGTKAAPYDFDGGVVDASTFTGDLTLFIGDGEQLVVAGLGNDIIDVVDQDPNEPDLIDLSVGGNDTVVFEDTNQDDDDTISPANYTTITGFQLANDTIAIDVTTTASAPQIDLQETDGDDVDPGDAVNFYGITAGQADDNLSGQDINFLAIQTNNNSSGFDLDGYFDFLMGNIDITVDNDADLILMAMYDNFNNNGMILFTVDPDSGGGNNTIDAGDDVQMVSIVNMSYLDYLAFGTTGGLQFVDFPTT